MMAFLQNLTLFLSFFETIHYDLTTQTNNLLQMFLLRDDIEEIKAILENNGIILYPTDTIWGLGCDATKQEAVEKINALKGRPADKSYVLLVNSVEMLKEYVPKVHPRLETLLSFHVRPLTIIYDKVKNLPDWLLADNGSVAIRVTQDPFCQFLIEQVGKPIVSTSANKSGEPFPPTFGAVSSDILQGVDYVVKHRQDDRTPSEPSVIAKLTKKAELDFIRE